MPELPEAETIVRGLRPAIVGRTITATRVVHADVHTACLIVRGELVGTVTASDRVELKATARLTGDIEAPVIVMEAGALHDGGCRMAKVRTNESRPAEPSLALVVPMKA